MRRNILSNTVVFLEKLKEIGVRISLADDKLHVQAPRGALTPAIRSQLQERGYEVASYLREILDSDSQLPLIQQLGLQESPLSYNQQHIWHKHEASNNKARFNVSAVIELRGSIDRDRLQASFNQVVDKYPALRTVLLEASGKPHQRTGQVRQLVLPDAHIEIEHHDFRHTLIAQRQALLNRALTIAAEHPFNLMMGPLLRVHVFRTQDDLHTLLLTAHQLIIDSRSLSLVMKSWAEFYNDNFMGYDRFSLDEGFNELLAFEGDGYSAEISEIDNSTKLDISYHDYVAWQRWPGAFEQQMAYWRQQLADEPLMCRLPTDQPRPKLQSDVGARAALLLDADLQHGLHLLSDRMGVSLSVTIMAAFKLVLARISGQDEIVLGSMLPARTQAALADVVGYVENTVILRTDVRDEPSFNQLVRRVAQVVIGAQANQDLPYSQMLAALRAEGNLSHDSLMQVYFNMLQPQNAPLPLDGVVSIRQALPKPPVLFDLTLNVSDETDGILLEAVYRRELFRPQRIEMLLRQLEFVLMQAVVATNRPIAAFSLNPEPGQIANHDPIDYPLLHEQFAQQALQQPDAVVIADEDFQFTYREIDLKANQVANYLHDRGIVPGEHLAVVTTRNASMLPVVIGVLRAGAVLALIDASEQTTQLVHKLAEVQPAAVIVPQEAEPLPIMLEQCLEEIEFRFRYAIDEGLPASSATAPAITIQQDQAAYLAFSQEMPEQLPVVISHRSLAHLFQWQQEWFAFSKDDRFSFHAPLNDDTVLLDLLTPVIAGGLLLVPTAETVADGLTFVDWLQMNRISVAFFGLQQVELFAEQLMLAEHMPLLRQIIVRGEGLSERLVRQLRHYLPSVTLVMAYGSAETALVATYQLVPAPGLLLANDPLWLKSSINAFDLLVLNEHGQLAGVGEVGEIFVRSPYLALGYLNRPNLTETHFTISRRFGRIWNTRDLARLLPDGSIELILD